MQNHSTAVDTAEAEGDAGTLLSIVLWITRLIRSTQYSRGYGTRAVQGVLASAYLQEMNGVDKVDVNLETGIATIEVHANDPIEAFNSMPRLVDKIGQLGFKAQAHFEDWM